jgi:formylglycine-generating enzyme required for sulfatase activity
MSAKHPSSKGQIRGAEPLNVYMSKNGLPDTVQLGELIAHRTHFFEFPIDAKEAFHLSQHGAREHVALEGKPNFPGSFDGKPVRHLITIRVTAASPGVFEDRLWLYRQGHAEHAIELRGQVVEEGFEPQPSKPASGLKKLVTLALVVAGLLGTGYATKESWWKIELGPVASVSKVSDGPRPKDDQASNIPKPTNGPDGAIKTQIVAAKPVTPVAGKSTTSSPSNTITTTGNVTPKPKVATSAKPSPATTIVPTPTPAMPRKLPSVVPGLEEIEILAPLVFVQPSGKRVEIKRSYALGRHEVTQGLWESIMKSRPACWFPNEGGTLTNLSSEASRQLPVEQMNYTQIAEFCNALSKCANLDSFYSINAEGTVQISNPDGPGYRLPTENEWEAAELAGRDKLSVQSADGWFRADADERTHPCGKKTANPWGFYDLHGNVAELCQNPFREVLGQQPGVTVLVNPSGSGQGMRSMVLRGLSYRNDIPGAAVDPRGEFSPSDHLRDVGFRVARTASGPASGSPR